MNIFRNIARRYKCNKTKFAESTEQHHMVQKGSYRLSCESFITDGMRKIKNHLFKSMQIDAIDERLKCMERVEENTKYVNMKLK